MFLTKELPFLCVSWMILNCSTNNSCTFSLIVFRLCLVLKRHLKSMYFQKSWIVTTPTCAIGKRLKVIYNSILMFIDVEGPYQLRINIVSKGFYNIGLILILDVNRKYLPWKDSRFIKLPMFWPYHWKGMTYMVYTRFIHISFAWEYV